MKQHYSEADLLETYYTQPGESMPVMMHLADCAECAARYERLEAKVQSVAACRHDDQPETFWSRQRISIMRRIDGRRRTSAFARAARVAAAAALVFVLGGVTWMRMDESRTLGVAESPRTVTASLEETRDDSTVPADPWQSDELNDYQSMVAWETWVESDTRNGDQSL
ncbi:MAG TPA: hypothetical protein VHL59_09565 [Thermoanaerobaculia bacterium]|nr:hypothetical protein [Thermoanaerobaculia bacterium]